MDFDLLELYGHAANGPAPRCVRRPKPGQADDL